VTLLENGMSAEVTERRVLTKPLKTNIPWSFGKESSSFHTTSARFIDFPSGRELSAQHQRRGRNRRSVRSPCAVVIGISRPRSHRWQKVIAALRPHLLSWPSYFFRSFFFLFNISTVPFIRATYLSHKEQDNDSCLLEQNATRKGWYLRETWLLRLALMDTYQAHLVKYSCTAKSLIPDTTSCKMLQPIVSRLD